VLDLIITELGAGGALAEIRWRAPGKSEVGAPIVINLL
jgi:hypothetical protein